MAKRVKDGEEEIGEGMPRGELLTPMLQPHQIDLDEESAAAPAFDDDAAATITRMDYGYAQAWLDQNSWLAEWQYVDYLKQSPNYDYAWRTQSQRAARISRFNVAKNTQTMSTQVRRGIFADQNPFVLEPRGKLAGNPNAQLYIDAWTEVLSVLDQRADFEYNLTLMIECQALQGTGLADGGWEERKVIRRTRVRKQQPLKVPMPDGSVKTINTAESDDFEVKEQTFTESWPYFEYRRLGTTLYDPKWRTPNAPELSAGWKVDIDYVNFYDLRAMRDAESGIYKKIPDDKTLMEYFLRNSPQGDAQPPSQLATSMNTETADVLHAEGENAQTSQDPLLKTFMKLKRSDAGRVWEVVIFDSEYVVIRNDDHKLSDYALGYAATWWNIDNCGYGMGIGRLNAGDQRMDQGVLNEVLKMIAFPMNAPVLYNSADGNAPTQNVVMGMGTFWGVNAGRDGDVRKALGFMQMPQIPPDAWKVYQLGKDGGEDLVGANSTTMQGNLGGAGSSAMRTAAGVNRVGSKADDNVAEPIAHLERTIVRWNRFKYDMVIQRMQPAEIRAILSAKYGDAILDQIDADQFYAAEFNIKVLAGQKLAAKAAISQLIPFLLQIVQQPQLLEYLHQKGTTINFAAIEGLFMQMSELQGREDIFVPLTPEEKQQVAQMNPAVVKAQMTAQQEQLKGRNKLAAIQAQGAQDLQNTIVDKALDHISGDVPLERAEGLLERDTDKQDLVQGVGQ